MRYRLVDLDLRFCPRKGVHDKTMEREMKCPWCDLAQDHANLLDSLVQGSHVESHVIRKMDRGPSYCNSYHTMCAWIS